MNYKSLVPFLSSSLSQKLVYPIYPRKSRYHLQLSKMSYKISQKELYPKEYVGVFFDFLKLSFSFLSFSFIFLNLGSG
jgi:hypothetical protein